MLLDITSLRYHHFTEPTRLIESAPPPGSESSAPLAGPPSLHFFLKQNTSHLTHALPKHRNVRAHTELEHITTVWLPHGYTDEAICALVVFVWVFCVLNRNKGPLTGGGYIEAICSHNVKDEKVPAAGLCARSISHVSG